MPVTSRQRPTRPAAPQHPEPPERPGVSSRIRPAPGRKRRWQISESQSFPLPGIVDHLSVDPVTGDRGWVIEATIDLVEGSPALTRMNVHVPGGLDPYLLQREFRCASPVEVVRVGGHLLARGIDPFDHDLPLSGFPEAATVAGPANERAHRRLPRGHRAGVPRHRPRLRPGDRRRAGRHRTHRPKHGRHRADRPPGSI